MKKSIVFIIIFLSAIIIYFNCNGDLLEEGPDGETNIKLRGIWIVGGLSGDGVTNGITTTISAIDLYDPITDTWYANAASTTGYTPVSFAAVASVNGKIYVIGGFQSDGTPAALNQIYDIESDSWSSGSITNFTPVANVYGAVSDDKIYILGGTTGNANSTTWSGTATTQCYNITSNTWITGLYNFGTAGANRLAMSYNGIMYNMGGRTAVATLVNTHDGYITSSSVSDARTAAAEPTLSAGRIGMAGVIYRYPDGYIVSFIMGGASAITGCTTNYIFNGALTTYTTIETVQYLSYSPILSAWSAATPQIYDLPENVAFGSAAVSGTRLYFFGGTSNVGAYAAPQGLTVAYVLDISSRGSYGVWTTLTSIPRARFGHAAVTINQ